MKIEKVWKKTTLFSRIFGRISAETSAEVSVNLTEISVSAETDFFRFGRSLIIVLNCGFKAATYCLRAKLLQLIITRNLVS